jgi:hypothetical protein
MYKLRPTTICLDEIFLKNFIEEEVVGEEMQMRDLIKEWWHDSNALKIIENKIYHVPRLKKSPMLVATMIYRLYGEKDSFKFKLSWVPLIHQVLKGEVFNWAHIFSTNISL